MAGTEARTRRGTGGADAIFSLASDDQLDAWRIGVGQRILTAQTATKAMGDVAILQSEEAIIQEFLAPLAAGYAGAYGLEDDCAAITCRPGHQLIVKTDAVAAGVHFFPDDASADIGWKALAVNVSDLAAKGAEPLAYVMSLAFPEPPTRVWMAGFAEGLGQAQRAFGIQLVGGDTDRRAGPLSITPCVFGEVPAGKMVRRATAAVGDLLYVSGTLGDAALGLALRRQTPQASAWCVSAAQQRQLLDRYLRPTPRLGLRSALRAHVRAAMDISDGLAKDLGRMCKASGVGARVEVALLPRSAAAKSVLGVDPAQLPLLLTGGDDYELLMCVAPTEAAAFEAAAETADIGVTRIGHCRIEEGVAFVDASGAGVQLSRTGYDHF